MKLHLGAGGIRKAGYINIDMIEDPAVDVILDLSKPLPPDEFKTEVVQEILAMHLFEHLPFNGIEQVLQSWYRVLVPGGRLVMEMPDFDETIRRLSMHPNDNVILASVFGCQEHPGQFHKWGWNRTRLKFALEAAGFKKIWFEEPTDYHKDLEPCLRVVAVKGTPSYYAGACM